MKGLFKFYSIILDGSVNLSSTKASRGEARKGNAWYMDLKSRLYPSFCLFSAIFISQKSHYSGLPYKISKSSISISMWTSTDFPHGQFWLVNALFQMRSSYETENRRPSSSSTEMNWYRRRHLWFNKHSLVRYTTCYIRVYTRSSEKLHRFFFSVEQWNALMLSQLTFMLPTNSFYLR